MNQNLTDNTQVNVKSYIYFKIALLTYVIVRLLVTIIKSTMFRKSKQSQTSILMILKKYRIQKQNVELKQSTSSKHNHQNDDNATQSKSKTKLFFDCHQLLFENTCLQQLKESKCYLKLTELYKLIKKKMKRWICIVIVFVLQHFIYYVFPLEFFLYYIKMNNSSLKKYYIFQICIMILGFLRLYSNIFLVSFMSSRNQFLKINLDNRENQRWIYKRIKYHFYRSLYLTLAFEFIKNIINVTLLSKSDDNFQLTKQVDCQLNIVMLVIYILRYVILFVVMDFHQSTKQHVVQKNDLVYKEQKKLWFIKNFMLKYIPDEQQLDNIIKKSENLDQIESQFQNKLDASYEDFHQEFSIIKNLKCKNIVTNKFQSNFFFTLGVIYITFQCIWFITIYTILLYQLKLQYIIYNFDMKMLNFFIEAGYMVQIIFLPFILKRILRLDILFDRKVLDNIFQKKRTKLQKRKQIRLSQQLSYLQNKSSIQL